MTVVLVDVILPIFFIVFLGYLLKRYGRLEEKAFARAQLYVLSPALVFMAMARAEAGTALILHVLLYTVIVAGVVLGVVQGAALLIGADKCERHAMSLAAVFMNSGFYGIPVCMLAFGEMGFVYATTYVVASSIVQSTLGIFIASAGRHRSRDALLTVLRIPIIYAIVLARILTHGDLLPPEPFMKMINLLGQSAIPLGLLLLGMQLERIIAGFLVRQVPLERLAARPVMPDEFIEPAGDVIEDVRDSYGSGSFPVQPGRGAYGWRDDAAGKRDVTGGLIAGAVRIVGGFVTALIVIRLFDFDPVLRSVLIVESSMPTAVNAVVFATEFNCRPKLVAVGILGSTLASIASVTLILNYLG